jgi:hypothetical protein
VRERLREREREREREIALSARHKPNANLSEKYGRRRAL